MEPIDLVHIFVFILCPLTWGSKLSINVDVYSSVPFLCGHLKGWRGNGQQPVGLIAGVHTKHCLTGLNIQRSVACHHNTCLEVRGMLIWILTISRYLWFLNKYFMHKLSTTHILRADTLPKVCTLDKETLYSSLFSGVASSRSCRTMVSFSSPCRRHIPNT